jgi:hypothetical protein
MAINIIAPQSVQATRLEICHSCKFYNETTKSCGTLILGANVENDELTATHYRKKIKLCGCVVRAKVKLSISKCPAEKWGRHTSKQGAVPLTDEQIKNLAEFMKSLEGKNTIFNEERVNLFKWANKVSSTYVEASTCGTCVAEVIAALNRIVKEAK